MAQQHSETTSAALGVGGVLTFRGTDRHFGSRNFAKIKGIKEKATAGNEAGNLFLR